MPSLIEVVPLSTAEELVCELLPVTSRLWSDFRKGGKSPDWIFRGQRDASWNLQPSAMRPDAYRDFHTPPITELPPYPHATYDERRIELYHVYHFLGVVNELGYWIPGDSPSLRDQRPRMGEIGYGGHFPDIFPPTELLDMFALAQHYGVPTRMLDWTHKPLVAAYFAAEPGASEIAVWGLEHRVIDKYLGCATWHTRRETFVAFIHAPTATNPNLAAQSGLSTLVQCPHRSHLDGSPVVDILPCIDELVATSNNVIPDADGPVLYKFTLPALQVPRLRRLLAEHRVHAGTIFPGLRGAAQALKEERHHT